MANKFKMQACLLATEETDERIVKCNGKVVIFDLDVEFHHTPNDYGNGYHVAITGDRWNDVFYDIRYDKDFHRDFPELWLADWAYHYWTGKDGAYKLARMTIEEVRA